MNAHRILFLSWFETDLEDHLVRHLPRLLLLHGLDLLIIGRQANNGNRRWVDLLAIDATGVIYIIELKLTQANAEIIGQVLDYRRGIKQLNREEIIRTVAEGRLKVDLPRAFKRHFGHSLPEAVNESQVIMIIAASIHPITGSAILELAETGSSMATFRYVFESKAVSLIPCCRDEHDLKASYVKEAPWAPPKPYKTARPAQGKRYTVPVEETIRQFWLYYNQNFRQPLATFKFIYEMHKRWVHTHTTRRLPLPLGYEGLFGRQLVKIVAESDEWNRVFLPPGTTMETLEKQTQPPLIGTYPTAAHNIRAYQRNQAQLGT